MLQGLAWIQPWVRAKPGRRGGDVVAHPHGPVGGPDDACGVHRVIGLEVAMAPRVLERRDEAGGKRASALLLAWILVRVSEQLAASEQPQPTLSWKRAALGVPASLTVGGREVPQPANRKGKPIQMGS